ncbi:HNH endonuclease [Vibrio parahaemolyticus]|uniref:hypothetical protein n=1 Tax=Vibrio parahaemolyticus TaxID=670 RepID=UPI00084AB193|nr:hypothetical protein [Vibrio parahaemolyticus]EHH1242335.1 HNH endonuclease [Vibrio parahaemolyticus]MDF4801070.1 HNH endonuclease [Vibrio parahaemolyticus]MDF4851783.1 HNH endonuclease [Vibrio parahaemolyticus]MDF5014747.1 HNH endonuclease [Vibrio parahaemolyticus]MDG2804720.1 HNH endonuclease [Vibrio parahaemolyticus]
MQVAKIRETGEVVQAIEALSRNNIANSIFVCPSCEAELTLVGNKVTKVNPHFRARQKGGHHPSCQFYIAPREIEFTTFIQSLLSRHPKYNIEGVDRILGEKVFYRADLNVTRSTDRGNERLLIECKRLPPLGKRNAETMVLQVSSYLSFVNGYKGAICFPGTVSDNEKELFSNSEIELWDLDFLASEFGELLEAEDVGHYADILRTRVSELGQESIERKLMDDLQKCKSGRKYCYIYQDLVGEILNHLFSPPLISALPESSDLSNVNRRDFVFPNYVENGFWAVMRERYSADYIVVDAKNYTKKVGKKDVLQVANYLKDFGAGLFGIIVSRNGGDKAGCEVTLREQWVLHRKLILVLTDDDLIAMLRAKADGSEPERVLIVRIEQFRLSM